MGKITQDFNISNLANDPKQLARFISIFRDAVIQEVNGNLEFDSNMKTSIVTANFAAANSELIVTHTLGRAPQGYILTRSNAAASVYDGVTANTNTFLYVRSSAIANTTLLVF